MTKKKYNWKARQVLTTVVDDSSTKQIKVDLELKGNYDQSNLLVLPSEKRKTKTKDDKTKTVRILSKKHRKQLEKIVERKKKKENRTSLLESLQKVQASTEELSQLTSIASVQTKGLKRYFQEESNPEKVKIKKDLPSVEKKINAIKGAKRRKLLQGTSVPDKKVRSNDPNIVGFESDVSDEDTSEEEQEEDVQNADVQLNAEPPQEEVPEEENKEQKEVILNEEKPEIIEIKDEVVKLEKRPAVYVDVIRNEEIQAARMKLPILAEEQQIMEVINENSIIIIAGETGSGKTTQVPQFLYEAGYALKQQIGVTEPRRVAAISMSKRVAEEMNLSTREVSYLIRFEGNVTEDTKIKFMTDGVLMKEMQSDFLLTKYSVIILDEAHERSVYTDLLIGFLSRIVPLRHKKGNPLKLIIMSATLRLADFTENKRLFKITPPVLKVDARQFPVTVHFNKRTNENYLKEAYSKAVKIHTKLPEGGILIFVTGQQEVNYLVKKLRKAFPLKHKDKMLEKERDMKTDGANESGAESDASFDERAKKMTRRKKSKLIIVPEINLDDYSLPNDTETTSDQEEEDDLSEDELEDVTTFQYAQPLWTLPLYSMLPSHKQQKVFQPQPNGCRLCIVSTNVAETSLTIPNVKYVVDSGKTKVKLYDKVTGLTSHMVHWTSKASADQRAGRAGRTGPGHCYRLYSSAVFNDVFQEFSVPEIQQKPVDDLYLQMKCMSIGKIVNFPFPTAPDLLQLKTAEQRLEVLGALNKGQVTSLGQAISKFPVLPRYGKMLALSHQYDLLPYTICLVAALSVQEVLLETPILAASAEDQKAVRQKWALLRRQWAGTGNSLLLGDNSVLLKAVGAAEYANSQGKLQEFCDQNGLRHKAVIEIRKLRLQLSSEIKKNIPEVDVVVDPKMKPPTDLQCKLLRQVLLSGMGDQLARKVALHEVKEGEDKAKFKYAYRANNMEEPVFLHHSSVLKQTLPEFVVYQEIYETNKIYMRGVTAIDPEWLPVYVPSLCNLSEPLSEPPPYYNDETGNVYCTMQGTIGTQAWSLPPIKMPYPEGLDNIKWFAKFFLEGKPFKKLEKYSNILLSRPNVMVKSWARLQPRTEALLKALLKHRINSKESLQVIWKTEPKYLLQEYLNWLPQSAHTEVSLLWPPC
ncbi:probable ATP-dependent RNA helicase kurz [Anthonomus grandis grandis]|uniref:probable ATP-dependent RNA helicase kurz n=1 Tax=Anthonomus grandis grandis TaxID=2921223 RepID=UPI002165FAAA|nr:probable ATP-dependent RNA helicase kurz [Anthonomus grandis grandis]